MSGETLGRRIAFYRKRCKLTQEQVAEKCSVTAQAVSKWENDLSAPDISLLLPLAELFGISADELLGGEPRRKTNASSVDPARCVLHIRVVDGADRVNVNLPLAAAEALIRGGALRAGKEALNESLRSIDFEQIAALVRAGNLGKLVECEEEGGGKVEIWVEEE